MKILMRLGLLYGLAMLGEVSAALPPAPPAELRMIEVVHGVAVDDRGQVYVADSRGVGRLVRREGRHALESVFAPQGTPSSDGSGRRLERPLSVAVDRSGTLFVTDTDLPAVWRVTTTGDAALVAGNGKPGYANGVGKEARFNYPRAVAVDGQGNLFIADTSNQVIRTIAPTGRVTTLAGRPGARGWVDGPADAAFFNGPRGVAVDGDGNVFVADAENNAIRKVTPAGVVSTLAGRPTPGQKDGVGVQARFRGPRGIAVDRGGIVYVADSDNGAIRRITPAGEVSTVVGNPDGTVPRNGVSPGRYIGRLKGIAVDAVGNLFVGGAAGGVIYRITPEGKVSGSKWGP